MMRSGSLGLRKCFRQLPWPSANIVLLAQHWLWGDGEGLVLMEKGAFQGLLALGLGLGLSVTAMGHCNRCPGKEDERPGV